MELLLVRHALPVRVLRAAGPADPGLGDEGRAQAARLAAHLAGESVDVVLSSPLRRALETAEPVAKRLGLEVEVVEDLAEIDRYSSSYVPMEELRSDPSLWAQLAADSELGVRETKEAFRSRAIDAVEKIIESNASRRVVALSHGGVINAYLGHVLGLDRELWFEPRYTSISRLLASRRGHRNIESLNELAHLRLPAPAGTRDLSTPARAHPPASPADYRYWQECVTLDRHYSGGHLTASAADQLMFEARGGYFADGVRWPGIDRGFWLVYRHISIDYLDEAFSGEKLRCGVRATGRSRRTVRMHQTLEVTGADARTIATADLVVVAFDTQARRSVEVPGALWAATQEYERAGPNPSPHPPA